jgi:hypothetical protein
MATAGLWTIGVEVNSTLAAERKGGDRNVARASARQPRSPHHSVNEGRLAQAGQVLRHCAPRNRPARHSDLSRVSPGLSGND